MQLHSANNQMTAHVNMAFSCPQNYDSLQRPNGDYYFRVKPDSEGSTVKESNGGE